MVRTDAASSRGGSRLLGRLPQSEYQRLEPHLLKVRLPKKQVLYDARAPIDYVYFPAGCCLSAILLMKDGSAIEVATIGSEGAGGLTVLLAPEESMHRVVVQVEGDALRMRADLLRQMAAEDGPLRTLLLGYHVAFFVQVSQSVACNGLHPILNRCCRWLLTTHDQIGVPEVPITHEFLAIMLGVRRSSVTEVLQTLHEQGLVRGSRGQVTILDRQGLEAASCECYQAVKDEYDRLLGG